MTERANIEHTMTLAYSGKTSDTITVAPVENRRRDTILTVVHGTTKVQVRLTGPERLALKGIL